MRNFKLIFLLIIVYISVSGCSRKEQNEIGQSFRNTFSPDAYFNTDEERRKLYKN